MLIAQAQSAQLSASEAEPGTRHARCVTFGGVAGLAALTALVPRKQGEANRHLQRRRVLR